jgi:hypothetical protein
VNSQLIEKDFVSDCLEGLFSLAKKHEIPITFFEVYCSPQNLKLNKNL